MPASWVDGDLLGADRGLTKLSAGNSFSPAPRAATFDVADDLGGPTALRTRPASNLLICVAIYQSFPLRLMRESCATMHAK